MDAGCANNTIGHNAQNNIIGIYCVDNVIGNNFGLSGANNFLTNFTRNIIGDNFYGNEVVDYFTDNNIGNNISSNIVSNYYFVLNNINSNSVQGVDFGSATHVYAAYTTTISINSSGANSVLSYINASNVSVNTTPTS